MCGGRYLRLDIFTEHAYMHAHTHKHTPKQVHRDRHRLIKTGTRPSAAPEIQDSVAQVLHLYACLRHHRGQLLPSWTFYLLLISQPAYFEEVFGFPISKVGLPLLLVTDCVER